MKKETKKNKDEKKVQFGIGFFKKDFDDTELQNSLNELDSKLKEIDDKLKNI